MATYLSFFLRVECSMLIKQVSLLLFKQQQCKTQ